MAFEAITTGEIEAGEPVKASTAAKIKGNFDDHETRLQAAELSSSSFPPIILRVNGYYNVADGILKTTCNFALTITGIRILIDRAGTSGTTEIDIQKKSGSGSFASVLATLPTVASSAGDDAISSDAILNPTEVTVDAGDILRLDLTSAQVAGKSFLVRIDYNRST